MGFDLLLVHFFSTNEIANLAADQLAAGVERLRLQLGLEGQAVGGSRFRAFPRCSAVSPDLDVAFKNEANREAARDFMDTIDREIEQDDCAISVISQGERDMDVG